MQNNNDTLKYLNIMIESLNKKLVMYGQLLTKTKSQSECISGKEFEDANWSQFEVLMIVLGLQFYFVLSFIDAVFKKSDLVFKHCQFGLSQHPAKIIALTNPLRLLIPLF